ncbi:hypothetical protein Taro_012808, partial [Colocasia esculenta]|nr:hypothetical protein [Colocasia esculenta]
QEIDGKLVAAKILSWRQHRVSLTHLDGKDLAAKLWRAVLSMVLRLGRMSRGVWRGVSSKPEHPRVPRPGSSNADRGADSGGTAGSATGSDSGSSSSSQEHGHSGPSIMERFKRMAPPSFKGESQPLLAESWMREVEKIIQAIRCVEEDKVNLATYMLQERADVWWASVLRTRYEDGAIEVTWAEFTRLFWAKFILEHIWDKMEQEFLSLTQGSITVLEYEARFSKLSKYAPHIVSDERRKGKKLVIGLKPSLRSRLVAFDHRTLDEALSAACRQESEMDQYREEKMAAQKRSVPPFQRQDRKKAVYQSPQRPTTSNQQTVTLLSPSFRPSDKKACPHCGRVHDGTECWKMAGKCLKCGSTEYQIRNCPRLQQGVQCGAPAPAAAAAAAPVTGRPGRPRAQARVFTLAREDAEQAENVTEGETGVPALEEDLVRSDSEREE